MSWSATRTHAACLSSVEGDEIHRALPKGIVMSEDAQPPAQSPDAPRELSDRAYAARLLHRAAIPFDTRDVGVAVRLIAVLEGDIADWLGGQLRGTVSREKIVSDVLDGAHRHNAEERGAPVEPQHLCALCRKPTDSASLCAACEARSLSHG